MVPEGTRLVVRLESAVGSDSSRAGDPIDATLTDAVVIDGTEVLPAGSALRGEVAAVTSGGKVKGRASVALRFGSITAAGRDGQYPIAARVSWLAPTTKGKDAAKIAVPAGAGAIIGAIVGGGKGAAIGAAIGGGGGTASCYRREVRRFGSSGGTRFHSSSVRPSTFACRSRSHSERFEGRRR